MAINTPLQSYNKMASKWKLPLDLWGGTPSMRENCKDWLPQQPNEDDESYETRVMRSFLFNVYKRTILSMVGNAFTNNIAVSGIPDELKYIETNANGQGQSLTEHAAELFEDILIFGKCHDYVDFPSDTIGSVSNIEYKKLGLTPYFARISPVNLIGWELQYNNGFEDIAHVRITDHDSYVDDDWCEQHRELVRVVYQDTIELWGRPYSGISLTGDGEFELLDVSENDLGYVPLQSAYANKSGAFIADPTLEDLAWLNLQHFQSSSDQHNILHIARVPFLLAVGFEEKDDMTIAANNMIVTANEDGKITYVEHQGKAIDAGRTHGKDIEEQMGKIGAEILYNKTVSRQTTSNRNTDKAEALSIAQRSLRSIEQMLEQNYLVAADWLDLDEEFEPVVNIGADLDLANDPNPVQGFIELSQYFGLEPEKALEEAKRRGLIAKHLTIEDITLMEAEVVDSTITVGDEPSTQTEPENNNSQEDDNNNE